MGPRVKRWSRRILTVAATVFLGGLFLSAVGAIGMYGLVHHTAQPEFCNSCHIMEPYYASWQASSHANVACIECHYEPGAVETLEGKFKALSQLAKYVTRTQGTKPWAEVSDQSCMRSGCHSVRMLEGKVAFKSVAFDHRHHLLESRRGRRLRCVTCHSQIVQGEHVSVTSSVCFMCHFMPGRDGAVPQKTSDCLLCHGPPEQPVQVAGREFVHADYVARGVSCRECHDPVISGEGTVRKERCHTCHAEVGHIERIGETEFLHQKHVTDHKVECFDCHDEISHGLLDLPRLSESKDGEGCGACHMTPHQAAESLYAGKGAHGVADNPSRMHETRVACRACHTGRTPTRSGDDLDDEHPAPHGALVAAAGEVDCLHCHGTGFKGMLAGWQSAVSTEITRLEPLLAQTQAALPKQPDHPARQPLAEARENLDLIALDGSHGAHNVTYALDVLRASAERIEQARGLLDLPPSERSAPAPFVSRSGCSTCHLGIEARTVELANGRAFPHAEHVRNGLECSSCHSVDHHGEPAADRAECASCHHTAASGRDPQDCAACHAGQRAMLAGDLPDHAPTPSGMSSMDCYECHGDPPDVLRPGPAACVVCHEQGFDRLLQDWRVAIDGRVQRLHATRTKLADLLSKAPPEALQLVARSDAALGAVERDGSRGAHNVGFALDLLQEAATSLDQAGGELGLSAAGALAEPAPWRPEAGCASCHAGLESRPTLRANGRSFSHRAHIERAGLDCATCHDLQNHGQPAFPRDQCASCHHAADASHDANDCAACHKPQAQLQRGELDGFATTEGAKSDLECSLCHGSPPAIARPSPALCNVCHEQGFEEQLARWRSDFDAQREQIAQGLERASLPAEQRRLAESALRLLGEDGSRGVHNPEFSRLLLSEALRLSGSR